MHLTTSDIAAILSQNNAGEATAIDGYYQILAMQGLPKELYDDIKEIISDEMNHEQKLHNWIVKLTGVQPAKD